MYFQWGRGCSLLRCKLIDKKNILYKGMPSESNDVLYPD